MQLRVHPDQEGELKILDGSGRTSAVRLLSASGKKVAISEPSGTLRDGVPVQLTWSDYIVLGEVLEPSQPDCTMLRVRHALRRDHVQAMRYRWT